MPNHEAEMIDVPGVTSFGKLDILQGCRKMQLAADAQEIFTVETSVGLLMPTRVPHGVLNPPGYFQGIMMKLRAGLLHGVWVDNISWCGKMKIALSKRWIRFWVARRMLVFSRLHKSLCFTAR